MVFSNLFNVRSHTQELRELAIQCLFDEQYEVRVAASTTLSGLYQCRYLQVTEQDLVREKGIVLFCTKRKLYYLLSEGSFLCYEQSRFDSTYCSTTWRYFRSMLDCFIKSL